MPFHDTLAAGGKLTVRVNFMQLYEPEAFKTPNGRIDYDSIIAQAKSTRAKYAASDLIRAEAIKIFADGTLEGNPYAVPRTLPNSPSLKPYLQPVFARDNQGRLAVRSYVDTASPLCQQVQSHPGNFETQLR